MPNPDFSYPVREPTGLGLGTFDVYLIRQKLYEGEFHERCEFQTVDGEWHPVSAHPAFMEVLWLLGNTGKQAQKAAGRRRAIGAGWKVAGQDQQSAHRAAIRLDKDAPRPPRAKGGTPKKSGLLGRFFGGKK